MLDLNVDGGDVLAGGATGGVDCTALLPKVSRRKLLGAIVLRSDGTGPLILLKV